MITSKRLILRKFESVDLDFLYSLDNDAEVMRYINGGIDTPREFIANNILPLFTHYDDSKPGIGYWVVTRNNDPQPLGWYCLREIRYLSRVGSIGYRFFPRYWRKGYATESTTSLLDFGFHEHGFTAARATTYEFNTGSCRTLEKLGFSLLKNFRGDLSDQVTLPVIGHNRTKFEAPHNRIANLNQA